MKTRVAAGVIVEEGKVLIALRAQEGHLPGFWEFPGGKCEQEETVENCLKREIKEELNIEVEVQEKIGSCSYVYPDREVELHFFWCRRAGGEMKAVGCDRFEWVFPKDLNKYNFPPANREIILKLAETEL